MSYRETRPSPFDSATLYGVGEVKTGNDGNRWKIVQNKAGIKRWQKESKTSTHTTKTKKKTTKSTKTTRSIKLIKSRKSKKHTTMRHQNRPSPSESATLFRVGYRRRGNDGNMWEIMKTKTNVKRWRKVKSSNKVIKCVAKKKPNQKKRLPN